MPTTPLSIAAAYYTALSEKNVLELEKYLHSKVQFTSPFATLEGKTAVIEAIRKLTPLFNALTIRATFGSPDQAMVVYDLDFPAPIGICPTAAHLTFQENLIITIELFFDARRFGQG